MKETAHISKFEARSRLYTGLNVILTLWCIAQIIIYACQLALFPCKEVKTLGICYVISYVLYMLVPILAIASTHGCNLAAPTMIYCAINIVIKIVCISVVMTVGWRHVGMCYINYELKILIICCSAVEILVLIFQILVLFKRRKINIMKENIKSSVSVIQPVFMMDTTNRPMQ